MSLKIVQGVLSAAVAVSGTFAVSYPDGTNIGTFTGGKEHKLSLSGASLSDPGSFSLSFGASTVTVTNRTAAAWPVGATYYLELQIPGQPVTNPERLTQPLRSAEAPLVLVNLGSPITADADGICASQSGTAATAMTINGALAASGAVTFDVPRNVVGAWTGNAVVTVVGEDEYGVAVTESSASGTSLTGKKAFKTITSVTPSANITSATVGSGDVLGLPVYVHAAVNLIKEGQDGAVATAGTLVAGIQTAGGSTATSGDVRGTYDPNAACDGAKSFQLLVALPDPGYRGIPQYTA